MAVLRDRGVVKVDEPAAGAVAVEQQSAVPTRRGLLLMAGTMGAAVVAAACEATAPPEPAPGAHPGAPSAAPRAPTPSPGSPAVPTQPGSPTVPPTLPEPTVDPVLPGLPPLPTDWAEASALHAARRLSWGATPSLAAEIDQVGLVTWLDQQLDWESIDDSHIDALVAPWPRPGRTATQILADQEWLVPVEMAAHETLRRCFSNRQLHEVMVEFWFDHFNVDVNHIPVALPHAGV